MGRGSSRCKHIMYEEEKKILERYQQIVVFLLLCATLAISLFLFKSLVPIIKAKAMKDHYDKIIREQNEREEQARQNWEAMKVEWQKEKDVMRREAEARIERDQEAFKMMAEELRNAKKEYEAKIEEIEGIKRERMGGEGGD